MHLLPERRHCQARFTPSVVASVESSLQGAASTMSPRNSDQTNRAKAVHLSKACKDWQDQSIPEVTVDLIWTYSYLYPATICTNCLRWPARTCATRPKRSGTRRHYRIHELAVLNLGIRASGPMAAIALVERGIVRREARRLARVIACRGVSGGTARSKSS